MSVLERLSIVAPLGVRFRDRVTGDIVSDGLEASVWPAGAPERAVRGVENRAGAFAFFGLPGMRAVEQGSGDSDFWDATPPQFPFVLALRDRLGRFLPLRLAVQLPVRGFLGLSTADPADVPPAQTSGPLASIPLASAASRAPLPAMAVIHAILFDAVHGEPAAWAVVEATTEAAAGEQTTVTGIADGSGTLMLPMPWPAPILTTSSGPPPPPLSGQKWQVTVSVRYRRRVPPPEVPDLAQILSQPRVQTSTAELSFGRELVLRSTITP